MYGEKCGAHFIRAVVLEELVWAHIKMIISYVTCHEAHFRAVMEQRMKLTSEDAVQLRKKRLKKAEKRIKELDQMFIRLYEDNVKGCISDERFSMMSGAYEDEQAQSDYAVCTIPYRNPRGLYDCFLAEQQAYNQAPLPKPSSHPPHKPGPSGGKPDDLPDRAAAKGHGLPDHRHSFPQTTKRLPHLDQMR